MLASLEQLELYAKGSQFVLNSKPGEMLEATLSGYKNKRVASVVGKSQVIHVADSFEIVCGQSAFRLDKNGTVTIKGAEFKFEASGPVKINGQTVDIN